MELTTRDGPDHTDPIIIPRQAIVTTTGGSTSDRSTSGSQDNFRAIYSPTAGYLLTDQNRTVQFGIDQFLSDSVNGFGHVLFSRVSGSTRDYLALYLEAAERSSSAEPGTFFPARYGATAAWQQTVGDAGSARTRLIYFAYGVATPPSAMPKAGLATYQIYSSGVQANDSELWNITRLSGSSISVDFSANRVLGNLIFGGQNLYKSVIGGLGSIPLNVAFTGNALDVSFNDASLRGSGRVPGQYRMVFVGPNAEELIITAVASDGSGATIASAVGIRVP